MNNQKKLYNILLIVRNYVVISYRFFIKIGVYYINILICFRLIYRIMYYVIIGLDQLKG